MIKIKGKIKWYKFRKGFEFIVGNDEKDIFVHKTNIPKDVSLNDDDQVEYEI